ncbi:MAG: amidohydrolase family protein [Eubacteriales bacterium]|nr:amidohydrolase family protein [Eubacteriales bacterium]
MSSKIRNCVNELNRQQDVKTLLPEYVEQSMRLHDSYARIKMMMEYYIFYEVISEGINPYIETAQETIDALNQVIGQVYSMEYTEEQGKIWRDALLSMRQEVMDRMQVLTGYVDCFVVYEYILNRIQYRFEEREILPEDTAFAQEVMSFIFGSQDNVTINDNLRLVVGQLPMRMTRRHYFDLIRECISVYKGSDISSLEGFLYMFRTSAMLYRDAGQEKYFTEFAKVLEELAEVDFETMDQKMYDIYAEKIRINASKLNDLSDLYMQIGALINETYTVVVAAPYIGEEEPMTQADQVIQGIQALFTEQDSPVWTQAEEALDTEEERLAWLGEKLTFAEGKQEKLYDSINVAEAALEEIVHAHKTEIEELGKQEDFVLLHQVSMLNSNSVFAPLEEQTEEAQVTAEMAEAETEKLIGELKELFQGQSRMLRRAIMAGTIEKLPTFFSSAQEVADYIINSLNQCDDEAEKYASKQLILDLIR